MATQGPTAEAGKSPREMTIGPADRIAARIKNSDSRKKKMTHAKIQTMLDLYTQEDCDETLAAQGEYLTALGVGTQMVQ